MQITFRQTYDVVEVAKMLGIGRNQAYAAVQSGQIPAVKIGKRFLIPKAELERLLGIGVSRKESVAA